MVSRSGGWANLNPSSPDAKISLVAIFGLRDIKDSIFQYVTVQALPIFRVVLRRGANANKLHNWCKRFFQALRLGRFSFRIVSVLRTDKAISSIASGVPKS